MSDTNELDTTVFREALKVYVLPKLQKEGYFLIKDIFRDFTNYDAQSIASGYIETLCGEKEGSIYKSKSVIETIYYKKITEIKNCSDMLEQNPPSAQISKSIIYLYLKCRGQDKKSKKYAVIPNQEIAEVICEHLLESIPETPKITFDVVYLTKSLKITTKKKHAYCFLVVNQYLENSPFYYINSVESLLRGLKTLNIKNQTLFFRGHGDMNYISEPSVYRGNFSKKENKMFHELLVACQDNFEKCKTHFDFISLMQHYGLPTRLLDVTLNPLIALYFACESPVGHGELIVYQVNNEEINHDKKDEVSLLSSLTAFTSEEQQDIYDGFKSTASKEKYSISSKKLLQEVRKDNPLFDKEISSSDLLKPIFVLPPRNNKRIINQKGAFVLFGLFNLSEDYSNTSVLKSKKAIKTFFIPQKAKQHILSELRLLGIDQSFVYPEIDKVAEDIKNR